VFILYDVIVVFVFMKMEMFFEGELGDVCCCFVHVVEVENGGERKRTV